MAENRGAPEADLEQVTAAQRIQGDMMHESACTPSPDCMPPLQLCRLIYSVRPLSIDTQTLLSLLPSQARDEASMKPSVARKLNEKIRGLETELEQLRSNKKVKELEKKVQVRGPQFAEAATPHGHLQ